jgi:starch synthase
MQIAMVASEVAPFSKEGGLADVLGALPRALGELGEEVCVISPLYRDVRANAQKAGLTLEPLEEGAFSVPIGDAQVEGRAWKSVLPGSHVTAYFLENDRYYDRDGYYTRSSNRTDYQDNSERFIFLTRGALEWSRRCGLRPDVFHCHDWHTGLLPIYVKHIYRGDFPDTATVFTIHNLAYQGLFWHWDMNLAGLPWRLFTWHMLEYYGNLSFLKAGLVGADVLTTVSKTYSREIQTEEFGAGMQGVLQERAGDLYGIVSGIDEREWDPASDPLIPVAYNVDDRGGKAQCKAALQGRFGLPQKADVPVVGMVGHLEERKGLDLLEGALDELLGSDLQFVLLGTGEPHYREFLSELHERHAGRMGVMFKFSNELAHLIEAGADVFLMPSRFEPCGLNQLYSMKYGTVPVVRATGGLADTVTDYSPGGLADGTATGFVFQEYSAKAMLAALRRALALYAEREKWQQLVTGCMRQDWSWRRSAREYLEVYRKAREKLANGGA